MESNTPAYTSIATQMREVKRIYLFFFLKKSLRSKYGLAKDIKPLGATNTRHSYYFQVLLHGPLLELKKRSGMCLHRRGTLS